jgi:hypothetical protein
LKPDTYVGRFCVHVRRLSKAGMWQKSAGDVTCTFSQLTVEARF